MSAVLNGEFENPSTSVENQHRICMYKCTPAVAQTLRDRKEKIRILTSLLFLFSLLSDMLTIVSVIFSLCESDIKSSGLSDILFADNSRSEYHSAQAEYQCEAISLAAGE